MYQLNIQHNNFLINFVLTSKYVAPPIENPYYYYQCLHIISNHVLTLLQRLRMVYAIYSPYLVAHAVCSPYFLKCWLPVIFINSVYRRYCSTPWEVACLLCYNYFIFAQFQMFWIWLIMIIGVLEIIIWSVCLFNEIYKYVCEYLRLSKSNY